MHWSKLDARLQATLAQQPDEALEESGSLSVFIRADVGEGSAELADLGAEEVGMNLFVANLTPVVIEALSEEPWVDEILLSGVVAPRGGSSPRPTMSPAGVRRRRRA